ncbi:hypothetical protein CWC46_21810 [Prodigiosinella confusarubida]|uniref:Uncharacterized protein n=1 Tax=Serratia sp. (strain ATCC 39006) TaxID=104623 RepID=A0A2I5TCA5_SERS3|nr:hypothetical protein [Serratia sp. ATCC 39006]AUH02196.1 hypothetical protein CWC46_21810 [Serratia sp. ATCC 39006]AUH06517.1 hypothetical protein Ser39006_021800 [Serratia sp. ATCC 39006]
MMSVLNPFMSIFSQWVLLQIVWYLRAEVTFRQLPLSAGGWQSEEESGRRRSGCGCEQIRFFSLVFMVRITVLPSLITMKYACLK